MRTTEQLHSDVLALLAPITRDRYTYTAKTVQIDRLNTVGIDLHDGEARALATAPDGSVAHYMVLSVQPRTDQHKRFSGGSSQALWGFHLQAVSGSPAGARFVVDAINTVLTRARLHETTGLLVPYFDLIEVIKDPDASPTRWYTHLRWSTTVH